MSFTYAISDIHGQYHLLEKVLSLIDLSEKENRLFLLGDYIDRGPQSLKTILKVKALAEEKPEQVFPLAGNHEFMFLCDLIEPTFSRDSMTRLYSMLTKEEQEKFKALHDRNQIRFTTLQDFVAEEKKDLIAWIENLDLSLETNSQIFVHAGIDEVDNWEDVTDQRTMLWTREIKKGTFSKDVIVGHTPTPTMVTDPSFHGIIWDGESHFYIDGLAFRTNELQILRFDRDEETYCYYDYKEEAYLPLSPYLDFS